MPAESWPYLLREALLQQGFPMEDPHIIAKTGWTAAELEQVVNTAKLEGSYDLITLMVGVNDQYRGYPIEKLLGPYIQLLNTALNLVNGKRDRVVGISIPDWGVTPFAGDRNSHEISQIIDTFNQGLAKLCEQESIKWFDVTELSRELGTQTKMLVADRLHPSRTQYERWVQSLMPSVLDCLPVKGVQ